MGKRSIVAHRQRRSFKRRRARKKKRALAIVLNGERAVSPRTDLLARQLLTSHSPSHDHAAVCDNAALCICPPAAEQCTSTYISPSEADSQRHVIGDYTACSPKQCTSDSGTDISAWEADSPSNVEDMDEPLSRSIADHADHIEKAVEGELPMVVVDEQRAIEVHLLSDLPRGSEVLRLSTEEYFKRVLKKEKQGKIAIKCLRNKVEKLKEQMVTREQLLLKEKEEAVSTVRKFWRDAVLEGGSRGGRMVQAALQKNRPQASST